MTASDKFMTNQWLAKALLCKYPFLLTFPNSRFLTTAVVFRSRLVVTRLILPHNTQERYYQHNINGGGIFNLC